MRSPLQSLLACLAMLALWSSVGRTQEGPKPGQEHERLRQMEGVWSAQVKCHAQPGKTEETKGEYTAKLDVGGFFLVTDFKAQLFGAPFQGHGLTGYDPFKKKYVGVWVDSMSPAVYTSEGKFDEADKVYSETMEGPDPKGNPMKMRMTTQVLDKDHMVFKMYGPGPDGKDGLMMEISYTRKK